MATPASLRPSISRAIKSTTSFSMPSTAASRTGSQVCAFSSTPKNDNRRPRRDNNRLRGLSTIYRSGTRFRMNIDKSQIPKPVADYKPEVKVDPNHGLWDFFYAKDKTMLTPTEEMQYGRAWTVEELRHKSWEDLHKLWWVCVKEQNRIATARKEKTRLKAIEGIQEGEARLREVRKTMKAIKHALTERWYVWEDARTLAETDPEVDLGNVSSPYIPRSQHLEHLEPELPAENESKNKPESPELSSDSESPSAKILQPSGEGQSPAIESQQPAARP
ncbi:mitochondrial 39-S ribosomal protein L47 (MRP-L47)-domain-containing protein [Xylariaceae sp. FL1019]|nr:mitochondrial 39-S ribosomal protein L47 (MRP-L47)-domain-containing protein [Xylariaceae sp. FL1019]